MFDLNTLFELTLSYNFKCEALQCCVVNLEEKLFGVLFVSILINVFFIGMVATTSLLTVDNTVRTTVNPNLTERVYEYNYTTVKNHYWDEPNPDILIDKPENNSIEMNGYNIYFGDVREDYLGWSWPSNNTIKLEISSLRTVDELETMCDHEVAHQLFPDYEHHLAETGKAEDSIYKYGDDMDIAVCDNLAYKLAMK